MLNLKKNALPLAAKKNKVHRCMIIIRLRFKLALLSFRDSALKLGLARRTVHHHCQLKIFSFLSLQSIPTALTEVCCFQHLHILYISFLLLVLFLYSSPKKFFHVVTKLALQFPAQQYTFTAARNYKEKV